MALEMARMPERSVSEAISPAGSSLPELMRRPVLKRRRAWLSERLLTPMARRATNDVTLVLIRLIGLVPPKAPSSISPASSESFRGPRQETEPCDVLSRARAMFGGFIVDQPGRSRLVSLIKNLCR